MLILDKREWGFNIELLETIFTQLLAVLRPVDFLQKPLIDISTRYLMNESIMKVSFSHWVVETKYEKFYFQGYECYYLTDFLSRSSQSQDSVMVR